MTSGDQGVAPATPAPHFRTDDLALAACLHVEECELVSVEAVRGKAFFIFAWCEELDDCVDAYHDGVLSVEPRSLIKATRHMRNKMFTALDGDRPRRSRNNGK